MAMQLDHEKLRVYGASLEFVRWVHEILAGVPSRLAVHSQLDRASTSVPLNIAEGNGKFTAGDRWHYFDVARGSALECAAALDVVVAKGVLRASEVDSGKEMLGTIVSMLVGLIRSNSPDRVHDGTETYGEGS